MKKAFLHTFGCKVNQYETQLIRERMARQGYGFTEDMAACDIALINSCTVTGEADRQCRQLIRKIARDNSSARIIVAGCYAAREAEAIRSLSPRVEVCGDKDSLFPEDHRPSGITLFDDHSRVFVKIQDGCDAFCTYCIVPYVRPVMWSKPEKEVLKEIENLVAKGYPEIVLSGIHLGRYDGGLVSLIDKVLLLKGEFRIRLSSLEMNEVTGELLQRMTANSGRMCPHLHIPLQSGADTVLHRMKRPYTSTAFENLVYHIKERLPEAGISTDVIVGFPGETDAEFSETRSFIEKVGFSRLHVFPYSRREGTKAALLSGTVPSSIVKERVRILKQIDTKLQETFWRRFLNKPLQVVKESKKRTLLAGNYIRLECDQQNIDKMNNISVCIVTEKAGRPWGIPERRSCNR